MQKIYKLFSGLIIALLALTGCQSLPKVTGNTTGGTIVLSSPDDENFTLAEEIAREEKITLVHTWDAVLELSPDVVLWVIPPASMSDAVILKAGHALRQFSMMPAVGIFTGGTMEEARQLWLRGRELRTNFANQPPDMFVIANGEHPTAGTDSAKLTTITPGQIQTVSMDLDNLKEALRKTDYLSFAGHGGDSYLRIDKNSRLQTGNLPEVGPLVIESKGCQTMRPWSGDSIALDFVSRGIGGYAGFVYSPIAGFMLGGLQDMPFRYSTPDFPLGSIVALQNRAAMQGFADFAFLFLLGDPRIGFQAQPPYNVIADETYGGQRFISYSDAPKGLIPIRIEGAFKYRYVNVEGQTDTADGDPFFNSRLQVASRNGDRYVLYNHNGGNFTIVLSEQPPFYWWPARLLTAAFDYVTLFTPLNGGNVIVIIAGIISAGFVFFRRRKWEENAGAIKAEFTKGLWVAVCTGLIAALYQVLRLPETTISTKIMAVDPAWLAGVFLLAWCGCVLFLLETGWAGKILGMGLSILPALLPAIMSLGIVLGTNILIACRIGAPIYNYHMGLLSLIAAGTWLFILHLVYRFFFKCFQCKKAGD